MHLANIALSLAEQGKREHVYTILAPFLKSSEQTKHKIHQKQTAQIIYALSLCRNGSYPEAHHTIEKNQSDTGDLFRAFFSLLEKRTTTPSADIHSAQEIHFILKVHEQQRKAQ